MAKLFDCITSELQAFIANQHLFFVATAPLSAAGHVNLSPKGLNCLRILSPRQVAYLDLTGSGNETSAHLQENGRITLMFCAFEKAPLILRLYGQGQTVLPDSSDWAGLLQLFPVIPGTRQIILVQIERVQTSCGLSVPLFEFQGQRQQLIQWAEKKGAAIADYHRQKNMSSIDGLPTPLGQLLKSNHQS